jgi:hypothetical protein
MFYLDTLTPWLRERPPPAFDARSPPSYLTLADARPPVNALQCHYTMACSVIQREGLGV